MEAGGVQLGSPAQEFTSGSNQQGGPFWRGVWRRGQQGGLIKRRISKPYQRLQTKVSLLLLKSGCSMDQNSLFIIIIH